MDFELITYLESRTYGALLRDTIAAVRSLKTDKDTDKGTDVLMKFGGFGPIARIFHPSAEFVGQEKAAADELRQLLSEDEWIRARESILTAYYTPPSYIPIIWETALRLLGRTPEIVLEPGCGVGNFALQVPPGLHPQFYGVEIEPTSAAIAKALGWGKIYCKDIMKWPCPLKFDLAIGNVPFIDGMVAGHSKFKGKVELHARVFLRACELVKPGGILALVTSTGTLDSTGQKKEYLAFRKYLERHARFLGAVRLPQAAFKAYVTEACTDILFLQVRQPGDDRPSVPWLNAAASSVISHKTGRPCAINEYFVNHPEQLLGELGLDKLTGDKAVVIAKPEQDTHTLLRQALNTLSK